MSELPGHAVFSCTSACPALGSVYPWFAASWQDVLRLGRVHRQLPAGHSWHISSGTIAMNSWGLCHFHCSSCLRNCGVGKSWAVLNLSTSELELFKVTRGFPPPGIFFLEIKPTDFSILKERVCSAQRSLNCISEGKTIPRKWNLLIPLILKLQAQVCPLLVGLVSHFNFRKFPHSHPKKNHVLKTPQAHFVVG